MTKESLDPASPPGRSDFYKGKQMSNRNLSLQNELTDLADELCEQSGQLRDAAELLREMRDKDNRDESIKNLMKRVKEWL